MQIHFIPRLVNPHSNFLCIRGQAGKESEQQGHRAGCETHSKQWPSLPHLTEKPCNQGICLLPQAPSGK